MDPGSLWMFFPLGYLTTVLIEAPILWFGLSPHYTARDRLWAGLGLTAFTYPIVVLVLPLVFAAHDRWVYLLVAETFAPVAECLLFRCALQKPDSATAGAAWRDYLAIVLANLASFAFGEVFYWVYFRP